jgi:hypothetical protein
MKTYLATCQPWRAYFDLPANWQQGCTMVQVKQHLP